MPSSRVGSGTGPQHGPTFSPFLSLASDLDLTTSKPQLQENDARSAGRFCPSSYKSGPTFTVAVTLPGDPASQFVSITINTVAFGTLLLNGDHLMCGKYPDGHWLHVFHQQPPRRPSTIVSQKAYELQWGCPIRTTTLSLTGAKQVPPNLSVSKRQVSRCPQLKPLLAPPLAGCTEWAMRQRCTGAAFPDVPPLKDHVNKAESGPEGSGRGKKPSPGNPFCFRSLLPEVLVFVAGVMASRLLRGVGALASQALRARGPNGVSVVRSMASGGTRRQRAPLPSRGWC